MIEREYASLNYDATFKELFKDKELLLDFINTVIKDRVITDIDAVNSEVKHPGYARGVIFDILATCNNGTTINIEMERLATDIMKKRTQYYWAKAFTKDLVKKDKFNKLNDTVCINVLGRTIFNDDRFYRRFVIKDEETSERLDTSLDIYFLELDKINNSNYSNRLTKWLFMLKDVKESIESGFVDLDCDRIFNKVIEASASMVEDDKLWIDIVKESDIEEKMLEGRKEGRKEGYLAAKVNAVDNLISSSICDLDKALEVIGISLDEYMDFKSRDSRDNVSKFDSF